MMVPFRKIRREIESYQHIYSDYDYTRAISPNIFLLCSGGLDSMYLLHFMAGCDIRFDVIHFVHGIRSPACGARDLHLIHNTVLELNKTRAADRQITVRVGYGQGLHEGGNVEARAHEQRWAFVNEQRNRITNEYMESDYVSDMRHSQKGNMPLYEIRNRIPGILAITAHHLNDNIEHTLMGLMRGKNHNTLSMQETQYMVGDATRFRPFLQVPKRVIRKMAEARGIEWNEDTTNRDNTSERNWLRNVIIPQLNERRNLEKSMAAAMEKMY